MENTIENIQIEENETGRPWWKTTLLVLFVIIGIANLIFVDYLLFIQRKGGDEDRLSTLEKQVWSITQRVSDLSFSVASDSAKPKLTEPSEFEVNFLSPTPTTAPTPTSTPTPTPIPSLSQEYYIPLGSDSVQTSDYTWKDTGAEVELDLSRYPGVSDIRFEVGMSVPTGKVEARLYNASNGAVIGGSNVEVESSSVTMRRSGNLSLPAGSKIYKVQMRTSLNYLGVLHYSRLRIR